MTRARNRARSEREREIRCRDFQRVSSSRLNGSRCSWSGGLIVGPRRFRFSSGQLVARTGNGPKLQPAACAYGRSLVFPPYKWTLLLWSSPPPRVGAGVRHSAMPVSPPPPPVVFCLLFSFRTRSGVFRLSCFATQIRHVVPPRVATRKSVSPRVLRVDVPLLNLVLPSSMSVGHRGLAAPSGQGGDSQNGMSRGTLLFATSPSIGHG